MVLMASGVQFTFFQLLLTLFLILDLVKRGSAGITSTFTRSQWQSFDIPLDNKVFAIPTGYNAPQQLHITQGDYDGKAVIISWVTADEPGPSKVQYGTSEKKYELSADGTVTNYTFYNYKSGYIHHCLVDGLEYETKYYYKIGVGASSREFWFQTPPKIDPDSPFTFGIIGDLGQTYNSLSTLEHYMQSGGQTVLFVGDLSYADRYQYNDVGIRWDSWGRFIERSAAYQPWIWSAGNHEIEYMPDVGEVIPFKSYLHRYSTPYLASRSNNPLWYAIRRASAHIIVLSSYSPHVKYTPQWQWLRDELKRVDRKKTPWLIIVMHVPIYNSNQAHFMEGESIRVVFERWFVRYRVDFIFAGHVHAYERSYRISNIRYNVSSGDRYPVPDRSAPVYVTVGDGGNQEGLAGRFWDPQPEYSAFREASYGHSTLEIKNRTHAFLHWHRNDDGQKVPADSVVFLNRHWASNLRRRKLKKNHLKARGEINF
ncbi:PREDICTED: bifunctional purple acid phosphatase 26 [Theobroma cacao]|uniref:Purple acid phosphatase n=1 Tax=Theobroma cacao TaxID=3641 RepID=A0AB32UNE2_THECC|nr:PREDICTED: bifunctional purple acid phosphatase 26 [Theobroma cacao]XP_017983506.1 PREDICTED: bifunctional purple acid phosphatase 26 [Theobroma cacao]